MLNYSKNILIILAIVSTIVLFLIEYGSVLLANRLNNPNHKGIQCPIKGEFKTLPDIIHNNISTENNLFLHLADYGLQIMSFLWLGCILYSLYFNTIPTLKYIIIITGFLSSIMILRNIAYSATIVPPTAQGCKSASHNLVFNPFKLFKDEDKESNECVDYMFSGHVIMILLIVYSLLFTIISKNTFFNWNIFKILLSLMTPLMIFSVSASRLHYTSDVFISVIITSLFFYIVYIKFLSKIK